MDIISSIDQAVGCHSCGGSLEKSVSDLFCSEHCQQAWHKRSVGIAVTRETTLEHVVEVDMSGFAAAAERASAAARRLSAAVLGSIPQEVWDYLREGEGS